jgi:transcriptional regulator with XRE-family HTH domain
VRVGNVWDDLFGRRVRALRLAHGLTQGELADYMTAAGHQMHQTTIAKLESASRPTNVGEIRAIASILGVPLAALLDYTAEQTELAGLTARLAAITAEQLQLEQRLAKLNTEFASTEAQRRELLQRIEDEREAESAQH